MHEKTLQKYYGILKNKEVRIMLLKVATFFSLRHLLVRIDTNNLCDLRCDMCPEVKLRKTSDFKPVIMPLDKFKTIAEQIFPKAQILYLSCAGEPLLTPRFEEYIKLAGAYEVPFLAFITNGMKLTSRIVSACINNRVSQIAISADGASCKIYESVRKGGSFKKLLQNLAMIKNMKNTLKCDRPEVRLNYTINKLNWHEVVDFIDLAHEYGIASVQYRPLTPFLNNRWSVINQLDEKESKQVATALQTVESKAHKYGINLLGHGEFTGKGIAKKGSLLDSCVHPWFYRYIQPDGLMMVCARRNPVGNLFSSSYKDIMNSQVVAEIKRDVLSRRTACMLNCSKGMAATEL